VGCEVKLSWGMGSRVRGCCLHSGEGEHRVWDRCGCFFPKGYPWEHGYRAPRAATLALVPSRCSLRCEQIRCEHPRIGSGGGLPFLATVRLAARLLPALDIVQPVHDGA
jgi:hypothetical protein